jgi:hypothetical protein
MIDLELLVCPRGETVKLSCTKIDFMGNNKQIFLYVACILYVAYILWHLRFSQRHKFYRLSSCDTDSSEDCDTDGSEGCDTDGSADCDTDGSVDCKIEDSLQQVLPKGFCLSILLYVRGVTTQKTVILICAILVGFKQYIFGKHNSSQRKQRLCFFSFCCFHISVTSNLHTQKTIAI